MFVAVRSLQRLAVLCVPSRNANNGCVLFVSGLVGMCNNHCDGCTNVGVHLTCHIRQADSQPFVRLFIGTQTSRLVSVPLSLVLLIFLLRGVSLENLASAQPGTLLVLFYAYAFDMKLVLTILDALRH